MVYSNPFGLGKASFAAGTIIGTRGVIFAGESSDIPGCIDFTDDMVFHDVHGTLDIDRERNSTGKPRICSCSISITGIAVATTLSGWINVALLVSALRQRGEFVLDEAFRRALLGIVLATFCMGIAVFATARLLDPYFPPTNGVPAQIAALVALIVGGITVYLIAAELFGAAKIRRLIKEIGA